MKKRTLGGLGKNEPKRTQTNPISEKPKMNVNSIVTKDYENIYPCGVPKNKPNSNPISQKAKMDVNLYVIEDYENEPPSGPKKTNPKQSQFRKSQMNVSIFLQMAYENISNWTLGEFKPNSNPIKANLKRNECKLLCYRIL